MSNNYLLIQNKNELPLFGIRLLGLSTKKSSQIGKFGTGLKEAIALLVRNNHKFIIFSGTNKIDFSIEEVSGQQEICFTMSQDTDRYKANEPHGLGIHPKFGHHDWTDEWQALREVFCNAIDEGIEFLHHDLVKEDEIEGVAGSTRIYIQANMPIIKAYGEIESRLLMLSDVEPIDKTQDVHVYQKLTNKKRYSNL